MADRRTWGPATRAVHPPWRGGPPQQPASVPIYQTSLWRFESSQQFARVISDQEAGYTYGRGYGNPTVAAFEAAVAELEGTPAAFAFDSGMAAVHTTLTALAGCGDTVVASPHVYGGTYSVFTRMLPRYGISVRFVDDHDLAAVTAALDGASALYVETISNPILAVPDLPALGRLCRRAGVPGVVDNTFASPYLCNPASFGFDYVLHSATKYIGGHSDLIGGVVCTDQAGRDLLRAAAIDQGGAMQPFEAWLSLRGLQTLPLRMERHVQTAGALASWLAGQAQLKEVYYPGLDRHPDHGTARRQLRGFGGMICFEHAAGLAGARRLCDALELAWIAPSLGGPHSLVAHAASTTHRQLDPQARQAAGISDGLIRMSVGLEDLADLVADFEQAFGRTAA
jgi:cystathionine beta-lyase/cystathionine gamma-synthase